MFIYFILHLPFESKNVYLHLTNLNRRFRRHFSVNYTIMVNFCRSTFLHCHGKLEFIQIDSDWKFGLNQSETGLIWIENLVSDWSGFIRIDALELIGLSRIDLWLFFIKWDTKRFLDLFGMIRIGLDTLSKPESVNGH